MLNWIIENLANIIVCAIISVLMALIIVSMVKNKRKGKTSCGCNCGGCPDSGACHPK